MNLKMDENYIRIPDAADLLRIKLKLECINKYDKIYRNILAQAKSGMFNPIKINTRDLAINRQEFVNYVEKQTSEKYEQLKFDLDNFKRNMNTTSNVKNALEIEELLTLIKLNKKLEIPAGETLNHIKKLLLIFSHRCV